MTNIATSVKRLWLRRQYALTTAGGGTLYATLTLALQTEAFPRLDSISGGLVSSTTARDRSVAFSNSDHGATTEDFAALSGDMLDLYDASRAALVAAGVSSPTDVQIYTEMLDRLQTVRQTTNDYSISIRGMEFAA